MKCILHHITLCTGPLKAEATAKADAVQGLWRGVTRPCQSSHSSHRPSDRSSSFRAVRIDRLKPKVSHISAEGSLPQQAAAEPSREHIETRASLPVNGGCTTPDQCRSEQKVLYWPQHFINLFPCCPCQHNAVLPIKSPVFGHAATLSNVK